MGKSIYRMTADFGRMGTLEGIFVADDESVSDLISNEKHLYFGEVLGKHSEVSGTLEDTDIEVVTSEADAVEIFEKYKMQTGYNPLEYISE